MEGEKPATGNVLKQQISAGVQSLSSVTASALQAVVTIPGSVFTGPDLGQDFG